jgi:hypothetical protein
VAGDAGAAVVGAVAGVAAGAAAGAPAFFICLSVSRAICENSVWAIADLMIKIIAVVKARVNFINSS